MLGKGPKWDTTKVNIGPLVFIIFINDLAYTCEENITLYLFADDAKMYCHIKDLADKDKLQREIEKYVTQTNKWQISLNINKCKFISISQKILKYGSDAKLSARGSY